MEQTQLYIMLHCELLDRCLALSQQILACAKAEDVELVGITTETRNSLVALLGEIQTKIERQISGFLAEDLTTSNIETLKCWVNDVAIWSERIAVCDGEILDLLDQQKEDTTKEIASLFKNKEKFRGYNLNTTKK